MIGLTASPERRTADQKDQLSLAFDAIIDGANMDKLFDEGILVRPHYRPHFIHDLDLGDIDISSGDFPVAKLESLFQHGFAQMSRLQKLPLKQSRSLGLACL